MAIVWAGLNLEGRLAFGKWKAGLALGDASYALYLVHRLVERPLLKATNRLLGLQARTAFVGTASADIASGRLPKTRSPPSSKPSPSD